MMGYDEVCLRMYTSKKPFTEAEKLCERDGANLVHIKNEQEQTAFNQVRQDSHFHNVVYFFSIETGLSKRDFI